MRPADIRRWRERLGISQREAMRIAGCESSAAFRAWQSWETGTRLVPWYVPAVMEYIELRVGKRKP